MPRAGQPQKTIPRPDRSQQADRLTNPIRVEITGDGSSDSVQFDGSQGINLDFTLATVNPNVGTFGDATHVPQITVDGKGRITGVTEVPITGAESIWSPLTNGDPINPELIFNEDGDVIMVLK